ncbi:hypothetical protein Pcinc_017196 [Petrolisthes cinctipes]|uniref:Myb/SANT-like DNA-binding domain-containing protein n=1 Tax=Petrolisthes cinctipes TaxID=88211 RepID=A0AAE1FUL9_PETCI|nr:hypothetical protein Pcinc_017196 [Petrolisthes cinctipes]
MVKAEVVQEREEKTGMHNSEESEDACLCCDGQSEEVVARGQSEAGQGEGGGRLKMSGERSGGAGEGGPPGLPPHQLLGLAGLVAGAGMGPTTHANMGMVGETSTVTAPQPRPMPTTNTTTTVAGVGGLMGGVGRGVGLGQALLNMEGAAGGGVGWGGWGELGEGLGLERGRSRNWTYEETLELISLYTSEEWQSKFSSEKKNHRAIWAALAAALTRRRDVSGDEARQRLNNLKALYNRTRRQLLAGEISSPQWEYWEPLHAFLGRPQPYIPITSPHTPPSRPPYPFPHHHHPHHHQYHHHQQQQQQHQHQHQGWLGALGLTPHHSHTTPRPLPKASPEVIKLEEIVARDVGVAVAALASSPAPLFTYYHITTAERCFRETNKHGL